MRDQCGVIFRQARKELEAAGLLNSNKEVVAQNSSGVNGEESMASDIDRELENLQVVYFYFFNKIYEEFILRVLIHCV